MTKFRKHLLIGIAALGLGAGSVASYAVDKPATECKAGAGMHHWDPAKFAERMEKRRAELHDKLKLTPAQEPAWNTFVAKTKFTPPPKPNRAELAKLTTPERLDRMVAAMKARETRMEEHVAATKDFYSVLTPEQKKIFDQQFVPGHDHQHRGGPRQGQG